MGFTNAHTGELAFEGEKSISFDGSISQYPSSDVWSFRYSSCYEMTASTWELSKQYEYVQDQANIIHTAIRVSSAYVVDAARYIEKKSLKIDNERLRASSTENLAEILKFRTAEDLIKHIIQISSFRPAINTNNQSKDELKKQIENLEKVGDPSHSELSRLLRKVSSSSVEVKKALEREERDKEREEQRQREIEFDRYLDEPENNEVELAKIAAEEAQKQRDHEIQMALFNRDAAKHQENAAKILHEASKKAQAQGNEQLNDLIQKTMKGE